MESFDEIYRGWEIWDTAFQDCDMMVGYAKPANPAQFTSDYDNARRIIDELEDAE